MIQNRSKLSLQKSADNLKLECVKFSTHIFAAYLLRQKTNIDPIRGSRSWFNPNEEETRVCHGRRWRAGWKLNQPNSKSDPESCAGLDPDQLLIYQRWAGHAEQEELKSDHVRKSIPHSPLGTRMFLQGSSNAAGLGGGCFREDRAELREQA